MAWGELGVGLCTARLQEDVAAVRIGPERHVGPRRDAAALRPYPPESKARANKEVSDLPAQRSRRCSVFLSLDKSTAQRRGYREPSALGGDVRTLPSLGSVAGSVLRLQGPTPPPARRRVRPGRPRARTARRRPARVERWNDHPRLRSRPARLRAARRRSCTCSDRVVGDDPEGYDDPACMWLVWTDHQASSRRSNQPPPRGEGIVFTMRCGEKPSNRTRRRCWRRIHLPPHAPVLIQLMVIPDDSCLRRCAPIEGCPGQWLLHRPWRTRRSGAFRTAPGRGA